MACCRLLWAFLSPSRLARPAAQTETSRGLALRARGAQPASLVVRGGSGGRRSLSTARPRPPTRKTIPKPPLPPREREPTSRVADLPGARSAAPRASHEGRSAGNVAAPDSCAKGTARSGQRTDAHRCGVAIRSRIAHRLSPPARLAAQPTRAAVESLRTVPRASRRFPGNRDRLAASTQRRRQCVSSVDPSLSAGLSASLSSASPMAGTVSLPSSFTFGEKLRAGRTYGQ